MELKSTDNSPKKCSKFIACEKMLDLTNAACRFHNSEKPFVYQMSSDFLKTLFIYLSERERERAQADRVAGRGRGRSRLPAEQGARCRTRSQDARIMT